MFNSNEFKRVAEKMGLTVKLRKMWQSDTQNIFDFNVVSKYVGRVVVVESIDGKSVYSKGAFGGNIYLKDNTKRGYEAKTYIQLVNILKKLIDEQIKAKV